MKRIKTWRWGRRGRGRTGNCTLPPSTANSVSKNSILSVHSDAKINATSTMFYTVCGEIPLCIHLLQYFFETYPKLSRHFLHYMQISRLEILVLHTMEENGRPIHHSFSTACKCSSSGHAFSTYMVEKWMSHPLLPHCDFPLVKILSQHTVQKIWLSYLISRNGMQILISLTSLFCTEARKSDEDMHLFPRDGYRHALPPHCMQGRCTVFSVSHSVVASGLPFSTCCCFRFQKMIPFNCPGNCCTIYSIKPGFNVSIEGLFFCATGRQATKRDGRSLQAMYSRATCCHSRWFPRFFI